MTVGQFGSMDFVLALALLAPGFLTLTLVGRLRGARRFLGNELRNSVLSLALSGVILVVVARLHGLKSSSAFMEFVITQPILLGAEIVALILILSIAIAFGLIWNPVQKVADRLHWGHHIVPIGTELWDSFLKDSELHPVEVSTKRGEVFKGYLAGYSTQDERPAIHLSPAKEVDYDEEPAVDVDIGENMLIRGEEITHITVLKGEKGQVDDPSETGS